MNPFGYLLEYFETNSFTLYLALFLLAVWALRFIPIPKIPVRRAFWIILAAALLLRVGWLGFSSYEPKTGWHPTDMIESDVTNVHAIELTRGVWFHDAQGRPSGRRPIGYPVLLGLIYRIFGVHNTAGYTLNLVLFALSLWLLFRIAQTHFGDQAAVLAAFFYAIYPMSVYSIKMMTDEHLFLPLWYGGLYLLIKEIHGRPVRWPLVVYGLVFGYATMTRTHTIFMPLVVGLIYRLMKYPPKRVLAGTVGVFFFMQLINLPWMVRNYKAWGVVIPYTANAYFIYRTVNSSATPEGGGHVPLIGEEGYSHELELAEKSGNAGLHHVHSSRQMNRWILTHPGPFFQLGFCRLLVFMGWNRAGGVWPIWFQYYEGSYDPARPISPAVKEVLEETAFVFYYVLFFCFIFSLILMTRRWKRFDEATRISLIALGACFLFFFVEQMVIYPDRKYRYPLEPLMIIAACFFLRQVAFEFRTLFFWKKEAGR